MPNGAGWKSWRSVLSACVSLSAVLVLLQGVFLSFTLIANMVPDERIARTIVKALDNGALDGRDYFRSGTGDKVDHYSECLSLSVGLGDTGDDTFVGSAVAGGILGECVDVAEKLRSEVPLDQLEALPYFRYWHGSTIVTRPMLGYFSVGSTRLVVGALLLASLAVLVVTARRRGGSWPILALLAPLVLTTDLLDAPQSIPHALSLSTAVLGAALVWRTADSHRAGHLRLAQAALIAGSTFVFVDLLFNPPLALALAVTCAGFPRYLASDGAYAVRRAFVAMTISGAAWTVGYAATWLSKWVISASFLGVARVRSEISGAVGQRLAGDTAGGLDFRLGTTTRLNVSNWLGVEGASSEVRRFRVVVLLCMILGVAVLLTYVASRCRRRGLVDSAALALPALVPLVWYELLRNHSTIHAFFTYRSLGLSAGVLLAAPLVVALARRAAGAPPDIHADKRDSRGGSSSHGNQPRARPSLEAALAEQKRPPGK